MGENIGAAARVMKNFGFSDLRIVAPRDGWPNPKAIEMSASAEDVIKSAKIFDSLEEAIGDVEFLYATTARSRDMVKPVLSSEDLGKNTSDIKYAIMFGHEKSGLTNEEIVLSNSILTIPVDPAYTSLNIAQSIAILCYQWSANNGVGASKAKTNIGKKLASKDELIGLFLHLEEELDKSGFFKVPEKRAQMVNNIRNIFQRSDLNEQEVNTLRGIIRSLSE